MEIAAVPSILNLTHFHHQVNEILNTEYPVIGDWTLLINGFNEEPEFINDFLAVGVEPEVTAHHETDEELLLEFLGFSNMESDVRQVLYGLTIHRRERERSN